MLIKKSYELVGYEEACLEMDLMKFQLRDSYHKSYIWFLEHRPVLTAGRSARVEDIAIHLSIPVVSSNRGGKMTYHGPGQLVVYIIADLIRLNLDIKEYLYLLENWIILVLKTLQIQAYASRERVGIWVKSAHSEIQEKKIAAFGLRVSKGISTHGFSFNRNLDLGVYQSFTPCGLKDFGVTSLLEHNINLSFDEIIDIFLKNCPKGLL